MEWINVFHLTTGGDSGAFVPSLFLHRDLKKVFFLFDSKDDSGNFEHNYEFEFLFELNKLYQIRISQSSGKYFIKAEGEKSYHHNAGTLEVFEEVKLYLSNPWHAPFSDFGIVRNLKIIQYHY